MSHEIAYGDEIGRQPDQRYDTPTNPNPWYGTVVDGEQLTTQQAWAMKERGLDATDVEIVQVRREATSRELWWSSGEPPPVFVFPCPVLERRRDGRIKVMAPYGWPKIVLADGWVRRPRGIRRYLMSAQS